MVLRRGSIEEYGACHTTGECVTNAPTRTVDKYSYNSSRAWNRSANQLHRPFGRAQPSCSARVRVPLHARCTPRAPSSRATPPRRVLEERLLVRAVRTNRERDLSGWRCERSPRCAERERLGRRDDEQLCALIARARARPGGLRRRESRGAAFAQLCDNPLLLFDHDLRHRRRVQRLGHRRTNAAVSDQHDMIVEDCRAGDRRSPSFPRIAARAAKAAARTGPFTVIATSAAPTIKTCASFGSSPSRRRARRE